MTPLTRIQGYAHVAVRYGFEEAVFLDAIVHWYQTNRANGRNFHDGRWWTHNSVRTFQETFPWWTQKQLRRIIQSCRDQGALLAGNFNRDKRDHTGWYSPSEELLELYGGDGSLGPNGQMEVPKRADERAQMGKALPWYTHGDTRSPSDPPVEEGEFHRFWTAYPRKVDRRKAERAWQRLKVTPVLMERIMAGLERDRKSPQWNRDGGRYIPYPATWLNNRRWEAEQGKALPQAEQGAGEICGI